MHSMTSRVLICLIAALFMATGTVACGDDDFAENQEPTNQQNGDNYDNQETEDDEIEVAGEWQNQFGGTEVIDEEMWDFMYLIDFDNDERWAITQNPDDDEHNPDAYSRIHWLPIEDDVFHYCMVDFGLDTEDEARESEASADEEDLDEGCGEFAWSELTRQ